MRYIPYALVVAATLAAIVASGTGSLAGVWTLPLVALSVLGAWNIVQRRHSLLRNYPLVGHLRGLSESVRGQVRQYFIESDTDGTPYDREQRSMIYQRAKDENDTMPFGTERSLSANGYEWINHSVAPVTVATAAPRIPVGGADCSTPYPASLLNISAMSFGSLSGAAIEALNRGAAIGGFAHDTGEGGLSEFHSRHGGDLIWEVGSGYFGCRTATGRFDPDRFRDKAQAEQVKMIEVKLSQGAKPGHGGVLPGAKVSAAIARAREIPEGIDCISPSAHPEFDSPAGLLEFVARLRDLSGGKPVGFKLAIGHRWEFLGICKAIQQTGICPDFIVVDGSEGGTGAAPVEFSDHVGTPRRQALVFVQNALTGCGLRDATRIGVSGKIVSGFDMAVAMALGADWCNMARPFMFALGCLQSLKCHTNECPVGIATQDPLRAQGLWVPDKAQRVANFHRHTIASLLEISAAAGCSDPGDLTPGTIFRRLSPSRVEPLSEAYEWLGEGQLEAGEIPFSWRLDWQRASVDTFRPAL